MTPTNEEKSAGAGRLQAVNTMMTFTCRVYLALSLTAATATAVVGEGTFRRLNEFKVLKGHTVTDNYHSPLPHE